MTENTQNQQESAVETNQTSASQATQAPQTAPLKTETDQVKDHGQTSETYENVFPLNKEDPDWEKKKAYLRANLADAFRMLTPGMSVSVTRTRPAWCARWIENVPVELDEYGTPQIDMDFLRESYGGDSLQLRFMNENGKFIFGTTVNFRGLPPRENGILLEHPDITKARELKELKQAEREEKAGNDQHEMFNMILNMQNQNFQNMITMMQNKSESANPHNQFDLMLKSFERFDRYRNPQGSQVESDGVQDMLGALAQMFMKQGAMPQAPQFPQHGPPAPTRPQHAPPPPQRQAPPRPPQTAMPVDQSVQKQTEMPLHDAAPVPESPVIQSTDNDDDMPDIVDELAEMQDEEIADTVNQLMEQLGPDRTAAIFQRLGNIIDEEDKGKNPQ